MFYSNLRTKKIIMFVVGCFFSANILAVPCDGEEVSIAGTINTENELDGDGNPTDVQSGDVSINGESGNITGIIIQQTGPRALLNHFIEFESGDEMETNHDLAISRLPPLLSEDGEGCAFSVYESITNVSGVFDGQNIISGSAFASGTVRFCSENNRNDFVITGVLCLAP